MKKLFKNVSNENFLFIIHLRPVSNCNSSSVKFVQVISWISILITRVSIIIRWIIKIIITSLIINIIVLLQYFCVLCLSWSTKSITDFSPSSPHYTKTDGILLLDLKQLICFSCKHQYNCIQYTHIHVLVFGMPNNSFFLTNSKYTKNKNNLYILKPLPKEKNTNMKTHLLQLKFKGNET